jgi:hypothetical protein
MKRIALIVAVLLMIMPLYVACFHDDEVADALPDIPTVPSLAGTWGGPGSLDIVTNGLQSQAAIVFPPVLEGCTTLPYFEVVIQTNDDGSVEDALICDVPISSFAGTVEGGVTGGGLEENYVLYSFTSSATGDTVYQGGLVFDISDSGDVYGFLFLHYGDGIPFLYAMLTLGSEGLPVYAESGLYGDWSGFAIDFEGDLVVIDRTDPIDLTFTPLTSFSVSGNIEDRAVLGGSGGADGGPGGAFGLFFASFGIEDGNSGEGVSMQGLQSTDLNVIGGFSHADSQGPGWSVFMLHK